MSIVWLLDCQRPCLGPSTAGGAVGTLIGNCRVNWSSSKSTFTEWSGIGSYYWEISQFTHSPFSFGRMSLVPPSLPPSFFAVSPECFNIQGELIGLQVQEFLPLPSLCQSATSSLYLDGTCLNILLSYVGIIYGYLDFGPRISSSFLKCSLKMWHSCQNPRIEHSTWSVVC